MSWSFEREQSIFDGWHIGVWWRLYGARYHIQDDFRGYYLA